MSFVLTLEYVNHFGDSVFYHIPAYQSLVECDYWKDFFVRMLERDHATITSAVCEAL